MNEHDDFDRILRGWIIDEGRGSAPAHLASDVATRIARRTPRPTWLALALGDGMGRPMASLGSGRRPLALLVVAGLLLAIIAGAVIVAGSARRELSNVIVPSSAPSAQTNPAASAALILFGISVSVDGGASGTYCTTFHTIRPDGSGERELAGGCLAYGNASWAPTGDRMIFDSTPLSSSATLISEVAADGGSPGALLTLSDGSMPAYSPDGSQIAYAGLGSAPGAGGIFIATADGTNPHQLTSPEGGSGDLQPRFSPDGSRLAFTRMTNDPASPFEVWVVNTDGTDLHRLIAALAESTAARWSSDDSHLLFSGSRSTSLPDVGLWTIDADGTGLTPVVTGTGGRDENPDWSPDGSRIVYTHFEPKTGVNSLRVMNADGSGVTTLLSNSGGNDGKYVSPDWGLPNTPQPEVP
jgi:TolB protein